MALTRCIHFTGAYADSNEWSDAAAGAAPDSGKGAIAVLLFGCRCIMILSRFVSCLGYLCMTWFAAVCVQTPTQLPTPLPTAEPTLSPSMVNASASCTYVKVLDLFADVLNVAHSIYPFYRCLR